MQSVEAQLEKEIQNASPELRECIIWLVGDANRPTVTNVVHAIRAAEKQKSFAIRFLQALKGQAPKVKKQVAENTGIAVALLTAVGFVSAGAALIGAFTVAAATAGIAVVVAMIKARESVVIYSDMELCPTGLSKCDASTYDTGNKFTIDMFSTLIKSQQIIATVSANEKIVVFNLISSRLQTVDYEENNRSITRLTKTSVKPVLAAMINDPVLLQLMDFVGTNCISYFRWNGSCTSDGIPLCGSFSNSLYPKEPTHSMKIKLPKSRPRTNFFLRYLNKFVDKEQSMYSSYPLQTTTLEKILEKIVPDAREYTGKCWTMAYGISEDVQYIEKYAIKCKHLKELPKNIKCTLLQLIGTAASADENYTRLSIRHVSYIENFLEVAVGHVAKRTGIISERIPPEKTDAYVRVYCQQDGDANKDVNWGGSIINKCIQPNTTEESSLHDKMSAANAVSRQLGGHLQIPISKLAEFLDWTVEDIDSRISGVIRGCPTAIRYANSGGSKLYAVMITVVSTLYNWSNVQLNEELDIVLNSNNDVTRELLKELVVSNDLRLDIAEQDYVKSFDVEALANRILNDNEAKDHRRDRYSCIRSEFRKFGQRRKQYWLVEPALEDSTEDDCDLR